MFLTSDGERGDFAQIDFATVDMLAAEPDAVPDDEQTLGRLLYHMLVGRAPFAAVGEAPLDPTLARPDLHIPSDLDALTMRALDPVASRRWADLDSMVRVLTGGGRRTSRGRSVMPDPDAELYGDAGASAGNRSFGQPWLGRPSRRALIAAGVVVVLALGLVGAGWLARTGRLSLSRGRPVVAAARSERKRKRKRYHRRAGGRWRRRAPRPGAWAGGRGVAGDATLESGGRRRADLRAGWRPVRR